MRSTICCDAAWKSTKNAYMNCVRPTRICCIRMTSCAVKHNAAVRTPSIRWRWRQRRSRNNRRWVETPILPAPKLVCLPHTHTNTCLMYLLRLFIFSIEQQVLSAVSIAPVQMQATPIVSIASIAAAQPTQIIASTPMAIATQSTQGQQIALASTQPPTQILGTSQITLAPGNCYIANLVQT